MSYLDTQQMMIKEEEELGQCLVKESHKVQKLQLDLQRALTEM